MAVHSILITSNGNEIMRLNATIQDLAQTPHDGYRYEVLKGVLFRMPPPQEEHGQISSLLIEALAPYCRAHTMRSHLVADIGYELHRSGTSPTVLAPDASIMRVPKAAGEIYSTQAPLLAVEIVSPSQNRLFFQDKAEIYLGAGTALVWVIWPETRTIDVWTPPATMATFTMSDTLDGGTTLPGLLVPVAAIFP